MRWLPLLLIVALIGGAGLAISLMAPKNAKDARAAVASVWSATDRAPRTASTPEPTPVFASFRGEKLRLPIAPTDITVLAFHKSSYSDTYKLKPLVEFGSPSEAREAAEAARESDTKIRSTPEGTTTADGEGVWIGQALELWRTDGRNGDRFSAVDCGARWDTPVFSPVDGTVMRIHRYHLYGKYPDVEIQIKPDAWSDVDVFILHVTDPSVVEGQRVTAGVTPLAKVRHLSEVVSGLQLRTYTTDGGNHAHVQFNVIPKPDEQWLVGEDAPGFKRRGD